MKPHQEQDGITIIFCEICDDMKLPKELITWEGKCPTCEKNTYKIALFDTDSDVEKLLQEA